MWTLVAALTLGACAPRACNPSNPPPPPPTTTTTTVPPQYACGVEAVDTTSSDPLSVAEAEAAATDAARTAARDPEAPRTADGGIPLVITEEREGTPEFHVVTVDDETEARSVGHFVGATSDVVSIEADGLVESLDHPFPPNDPYLPHQWGLSNATTTFGAAWETATGDGVTVAVVDTGARSGHEDLAGTVLAGWTFQSNSSTDQDVTGSPNDPATDEHGHGTHVTGIIAATADNGVGVAGAAPHAAVLPVKALHPTGTGGASGWSSDVARSITWAVDHGADVVNLSLGSTASSFAMLSSIRYAREEHGVVVVASGGNNGKGGACTYPAWYPETLAVAALDQDLDRASFSTTATYLDLAAPGMSILSTWSSANDSYAYLNGTSMAAPFVAAAVALLVEACPDRDPDWYRDRLLATATDLGQPSYEVGAGLVNPKAALDVGC